MRLYFLLGLSVWLASCQTPDVRTLSGTELTQQLKDDQSRLGALRELLRRVGDEDAQDPKKFETARRDPELVLCPQEDGRPPLFAVLSEFMPEPTPDTGFDESHRDRLFPKVKKPHVSSVRKQERVIDVFKSDGTCIAPFGGNNAITDGLFMNVNGGPLVDRVDPTHYSLDGLPCADTLEVRTVLENPRTLFSVVFNFDLEKWAYDWYFDLTKDEKDGTWEIHLGPKTDHNTHPDCPGAKIDRRVTYHWDRAKGTWVGPPGKPGDHFRVTTGKDPDKALKDLRAEGLSFPREPEPPRPPPPALFGPPEPEVRAPDLPFRPASLRVLSDEAILRYMGKETKRASQRVSVPAAFWSLEPKVAALGFVQENRSSKQRKTVKLAVDDLESVQPPAAATMSYTGESSRCYNAFDTHWLLRCDPRGSWVAYGSQWEEGVALKGEIQQGRIYNFKICDLSYPEACRWLNLVWWLSRIRSDVEGYNQDSGIFFSTGDGRGSLAILPRKGEKVEALELKGVLWVMSLAGRWSGHYTTESCLNFAAVLLEDILPDRLGERWPKSRILFEEGRLEEDPPGQVKRACAEILRRGLKEKDAPGGLLRVAIQAAGERGWADLLPELREIESEGSLGPESKEAIARIEEGNDPDALARKAVAGNKAEAWALEQLRTRFPDQYLSILKRRLQSGSEPDGSMLFRELGTFRPEAALEIARALPAGRRDLVAIRAFSMLMAAGMPIPDETKRLESLMAAALDPDLSLVDRHEAIDLLVPPSLPGRFKHTSIDETLNRLIDLKDLEESATGLSAHAAAALLRRDGARQAPRVLRFFQTCNRSFARQSLLGPLARAAREDGTGRESLLSTLRQELRETDLMISELALTAWAADLRELKPDLERIATATPEAPEGELANTAGAGRKPVEGRCHAARRVAALWNEEDVPTRIKLLIAFALQGGAASVVEGEEEHARLLDEAVKAAQVSLDAKGRVEVNRFLGDIATGLLTKGQTDILNRMRVLLKKD